MKVELHILAFRMNPESETTMDDKTHKHMLIEKGKDLPEEPGADQIYTPMVRCFYSVKKRNEFIARLDQKKNYQYYVSKVEIESFGEFFVCI